MLSPSPKSSLASPSTEATWRGRVDAWRRSGLTVDAFCVGKPYAAGTLRAWSSRLRRATATTFVELRPRASAPTPPACNELVVEVGSARVRVPRGFDPSLLVAVVAALGEGTR